MSVAQEGARRLDIMLRTLRVRLARAAAAALVLGAVSAALPASATAGGYHGPRVHAGFWFPLPPPPPFFFPPAPPVVYRHRYYYDRPYYRYDRYDRHERYKDRHERWDDRHERRNDRHERWD
jgi:hypothetical protein